MRSWLEMHTPPQPANPPALPAGSERYKTPGPLHDFVTERYKTPGSLHDFVGPRRAHGTRLRAVLSGVSNVLC